MQIGMQSYSAFNMGHMFSAKTNNVFFHEKGFANSWFPFYPPVIGLLLRNLKRALVNIIQAQEKSDSVK